MSAHFFISLAPRSRRGEALPRPYERATLETT